MSHSFYIENVNNLPFQDTLNSLGFNNLLFTEDSPEPKKNIWPADTAYLYIDQTSIRPIETTYTNGTFIARIFAYSSPEDYELAIKLISEIASRHNAQITPEDNETMDVDNFLKHYDIDWIEGHCKTMFEMLVDSFNQHKSSCTMSGTVRELEAGPRFFEQVLSSPPNAATEFYQRFKTLNYLESRDSFIANGITAHNEAGDKEVVFSVYGPGVDTILSDNVDAIGIRIEGDDGIYVTTEQLADALGNRATWLSESILNVPPLGDSEWNDLVTKLKTVAQADMFYFGKSVEVSQKPDNIDYKSLFSEQEWQNLLYSPILVFALVAGADGSIDKKEIQNFQKQLLMGLIVENDIMQQLMADLIPDVAKLLKEVLDGKIDPKTTLEEIVVAVNSNLPGEDAIAFKMSLMEIGKSIAEASGGFLGIFGSKISKEEEQTLAILAMMLGLITQ